jgi:hypothetical protein
VGAEDLRVACGELILALNDASYSGEPEKSAALMVNKAASAIEPDSPYRKAADQLKKAIVPDLPQHEAIEAAEDAQRKMAAVSAAA